MKSQEAAAAAQIQHGRLPHPPAAPKYLGPNSTERVLSALEQTDAAQTALQNAQMTASQLLPGQMTLQHGTWQPQGSNQLVSDTYSDRPHVLTTAQELATVMTGDLEGGSDLRLVDHYLALITGQMPSAPTDGYLGQHSQGRGTTVVDGVQVHHAPEPEAGRKYINLKQLGLDRLTLENQGVAPHHITRLHYMLHGQAVGFATLLSVEQARLGVLLQDKAGVPLPDRLMAFIAGKQNMDEAGGSGGGITTAMLDARPAPPGSLQPHLQEDAVIQPAEETMDIDEATAMASAGNVTGLRRLLGRYRAMHIAVRAHVQSRLKHECDRAQRLQDKLDATNSQLQASEQLAQELRTQAAICEEKMRQAELNLAAEQEVLFAERAVSAALRDEIAQLEAQWSAQQAEVVYRVNEQLEAMQAQAEGQVDLRDQYLERTRELVMLQLRYDHEQRKSVRLLAELNAAQASGNLAASQLQALQQWKDRVEARSEASEGWAMASEAVVLGLRRKLDKEVEEHKRTKERSTRLQQQIEAARCAATDIYARASKQVRDQAEKLRTHAERITSLERQLQETKDILKIRQFEADAARASCKAVHGQMERILGEQKAQLDKRVALERQIAELTDQIKAFPIERDRLSRQVEQLEADLATVRELLGQKATQLEEVKTFADELDHHKAKQEELEDSSKELAAQLAAAQQQVQEKDEELQLLRARETELASALEQLAEFRNKTESLNQQLVEVTQEKDVSHNKLEACKKELSQSEAQLQALQAQLAAAQAAAEKAVSEGDKGKAVSVRQLQELRMQSEQLAQQQDKISSLQQEVAELSKLHGVISGLRSDLRTALARASTAEAAQVSALTDRSWWQAARGMLQGSIQEMCASSQQETEALQELCGVLQEELAVVQGQMLALPLLPEASLEDLPEDEPDSLQEAVASADSYVQLIAGQTGPIQAAGSKNGSNGSSVTFPKAGPPSKLQLLLRQQSLLAGRRHLTSLSQQSAANSRKLSSNLQQLVQRVAGLVQQQAGMREKLMEQVQAMEEKEPTTVQEMSSIWQTALETTRENPKVLQGFQDASSNPALKHSSSGGSNSGDCSSRGCQGTGGQQPVSYIEAFAQLVPASVAASATQQAYELRQQLGQAEGALVAAKASAEAASAALEQERQCHDVRQEHWTQLVAQLQQQIVALVEDLAAADGGRKLAEHATLVISKELTEAHYQVSKAQEREVTLSHPGMVPLRRVDRGVQTSYADIWVMSPPRTPAEHARRATSPPNLPPSLPMTTTMAHECVTTSPELLFQELSQASYTAAPPAHMLQLGSVSNDHPDMPTARDLSRTEYAAHTGQDQTQPAVPTQQGESHSQETVFAGGGFLVASRPSSPETVVRRSRSNSPQPGMVLDPLGGGMRQSKSSVAEAARTASMCGGRPCTPPSGGPLTPTMRPGSGGLSVGLRPASPQPLQHRAIRTPSAGRARSHSNLSRPGTSASTAAGSDTYQSMVWAGEGLREWDWMGDCAALVQAAEPLSLQETLDIIAEVNHAKASSDEAASQGGYPAAHLSVFLGAYVHKVYQGLFGPRPVQPMARIIASVITHAEAVYTIRIFGLQTGILKNASPGSPSAGPASPAALPPALTQIASFNNPPSMLSSQLLPAARLSSQAGSLPTSPKVQTREQQSYSEGGAVARPGTSPALQKATTAGALRASASKALRPSTAFPSHEDYSRRQKQLEQGSNAGLIKLTSPRKGSHNNYLQTASFDPVLALQPVRTQDAVTSPADTDRLGHTTALAAATGAARLTTPMFHTRITQPDQAQEEHQQSSWPLSPVLLHGGPVHSCLSWLTILPGAQEVARFVSQGCHMDHLALHELGAPILEPQAPQLCHLLSHISEKLGLELTPYLFLREPGLQALGKPQVMRITKTPSEGISMAPAMLLQIPHLADVSLIPATGKVFAGKGRSKGLPRLADGSFGWRRRAVLLLSADVLQSCLAVQGPLQTQSPSLSRNGARGQGQGVFAIEEVHALLAMALAPMALPGGGGWRLDTTTAQGSKAPLSDLPALADVTTADTLSLVMPGALVPYLPVQVRAQWHSIAPRLSKAVNGCDSIGDRAALLCADGKLHHVVSAIYKSCHVASGVVLPSWPSPQQLIQQARELLLSVPSVGRDTTVQQPAAVLQALLDSSSSAAGPTDAHSYALLRLAHLLHWSQQQGHREPLQK